VRAGEDERAAAEAEEALGWSRGRLAFAQAATIRRWLLVRASERGESIRGQIEDLARLEALSGQFEESALQWRQRAELASGHVERATHWLEEGRMWLRAGSFGESRAAMERAKQELAGRLHRSVRARLLGLLRLKVMGVRGRREALRGEDAALTPEVLTESRLEALGLRLDPLIQEREESADALEVLGWEHGSAGLLARAWRVELERLLERDFEGARQRSEAVSEELVRYHLKRQDSAGALAALTARARVAHLSGDYASASALFREAGAVSQEVGGADQIERAEFYYWSASYDLDKGRYDKVEGVIERLMREERHLVMASLYGHRLGVRLSMLFGSLKRAQSHLDRLKEGLLGASEGSLWSAWWSWQVARHQLAFGWSEVASERLEMTWEALRGSGLSGWPLVALRHHMVSAQALLARLDRERGLGEVLARETERRLRRVLRQLKSLLEGAPPLLAAEGYRALARYELMNGKGRRALGYIEEAVYRMGTVPSPVAEACCLEVRGHILQSMGREEGRAMVQQARQVYEHYRVVAPLMLEGWPAPRELSALRADS
jgi:tetratricopeptide (TPR) repeat protein